jgi:hypothetical protein
MFMADAAGSVLTGMGVAALSWVALNFFGKPILGLREKRREALEVGERYAYVGLHDILINDDGIHQPAPDEYQKRALAELRDAGNSLRAHFRERSLATQIYCWIFGYDLDYAARSLLGLAEAARGYHIGERARRLTLHALFVALGATHHLSAGEIAAAQTEMKQWHDGNRDMTISSNGADNA